MKKILLIAIATVLLFANSVYAVNTGKEINNKCRSNLKLLNAGTAAMLKNNTKYDLPKWLTLAQATNSFLDPEKYLENKKIEGPTPDCQYFLVSLNNDEYQWLCNLHGVIDGDKTVSFRYREDMPNTLNNITLDVKPGEHVAIVGYNGAGKTTLIKLLMRLYDPTEGSIEYHGEKIAEYLPSDYRRRFGVVFQDFQLYGAKLSENVVMDDYSDDELKAAEKNIRNSLERAGFAERLEKLNDGLMTSVTTEFDEKGTDFSGGEGQKIAISRAFYKDADILIMDEPSSALDPIAEYELNKAMEEAAEGKTVFYISHRLSTTRNADRIIMLEKGRIIEEGSHEELLALNGKYAEMWQVQASNYRE